MVTNPRMVFPGGNTASGFFSFYQYLIPETARRKYVVKGGPGVGKSSMMKKLGEMLVQQGLEVEFHWCSSDNDSLDGMTIPRYQVAVVDGTAPHIVDPRFPGAVDEIVNLGQCWERDLLVEARETIIETTREIGFCFELAYGRLAEAAQAYQEQQACIQRACRQDRVRAVTRQLGALLEREPVIANNQPLFKSRHLFASAITPGGVVSHTATLFPAQTRVYVLRGHPGCGADSIMDWLGKTAEIAGHTAEHYHCPLFPSALESLYLPDLELAFINLSRQVVADLDQQVSNYPAIVMEVELDQHLETPVLNRYCDVIKEAGNRVQERLEAAVSMIKQAKQLHDALEVNYVGAMDFAAVNAVRDQLAADILNLCR